MYGNAGGDLLEVAVLLRQQQEQKNTNLGNRKEKRKMAQN